MFYNKRHVNYEKALSFINEIRLYLPDYLLRDRDEVEWFLKELRRMDERKSRDGKQDPDGACRLA